MPKISHALRNTFGYYTLFTCIGLSVGIAGPTIPSLALQTHSSFSAIGGIFLAGPIGNTIGIYIGGRMFDKRARGHLVMGLAQLFASVMIFLIPVSPEYWVLMLVNVLLGFSNGIINTGTNTFLMWTHREKASPYMNGLHFCFGLGAFSAPFIFGLLHSHGGSYRDAYWIMAAIGVLSAIYVVSLGESPSAAHQEESKTSTVRLRPYLPIVIAAMFYLFFYVSAEITYGGWLFTFVTKLSIATVAQGAFLTSGFWFSFTVGRFISILTATRIKPEKIVGVSLICCIAIAGVILIIPSTLVIMWGISIGLGLFMAPIWPSGYTMAGQSVKLTARMSSIILLGDSIGGMILPTVTGGMIERFGPRSMPLLILVSLILTMFAFIMMVWRKRVTDGQTGIQAAE
jgi:FHS family Na+ dependent glucose MFS transporter 1